MELNEFWSGRVVPIICAALSEAPQKSIPKKSRSEITRDLMFPLRNEHVTAVRAWFSCIIDQSCLAIAKQARTALRNSSILYLQAKDLTSKNAYLNAPFVKDLGRIPALESRFPSPPKPTTRRRQPARPEGSKKSTTANLAPGAIRRNRQENDSPRIDTFQGSMEIVRRIPG
jgi:hypothetical protein